MCQDRAESEKERRWSGGQPIDRETFWSSVDRKIHKLLPLLLFHIWDRTLHMFKREVKRQAEREETCFRREKGERDRMAMLGPKYLEQ